MYTYIYILEHAIIRIGFVHTLWKGPDAFEISELKEICNTDVPNYVTFGLLSSSM